MADRRRMVASVSKSATGMTHAEHQLEEFAEDLGKLLGSAQSNAENWLGQRKAIVTHLEGIRDTASELLERLGNTARMIRRRGQAQAAGVVKKKRILSPAARKRISDAQKARWAKHRAGK